MQHGSPGARRRTPYRARRGSVPRYYRDRGFSIIRCFLILLGTLEGVSIGTVWGAVVYHGSTATPVRRARSPCTMAGISSRRHASSSTPPTRSHNRGGSGQGSAWRRRWARSSLFSWPLCLRSRQGSILYYRTTTSMGSPVSGRNAPARSQLEREIRN